MSRRRDRGAEFIANPRLRSHPFLAFDHPTYSAGDRHRFRERLTVNIDQHIIAADVLDWDVLDRVISPNREESGRQTLERLLAASYYLPTGDVGFVSYAWSRLFSIREVIFRELVLEFYSTLHFDWRSTDFEEASLTFQLGGQPRAMSIREFAQALELYTADEVHNPHFMDHLTVGRRDQYTSIEVAEAWGQVAIGPYGERAPSYRFIRSPVHRLVHRLLAASIVARREGPEKVHQPDLFYLHSIIQGTLINVPWRLAYWMARHATGSRDTSSICGGQYITRLARWYGIGDDTLQTCTPVSPGMEYLGIHRLLEIGILEPALEPDRFLWVPTLRPDEQPQRIGRGGGRAAGRGRARGRDAGHSDLQQRMERMELEYGHHLAYQDRMLHQLLDHHQLQWQPYVPYDFGGPARQPDGDDSDDE